MVDLNLIHRLLGLSALDADDALDGRWHRQHINLELSHTLIILIII